MTLLDYNSVRGDIQNGDLLLWEPTNLFGRIVSRLSGGKYSHVASVSWSGDVLECHEMLQWQGGQTTNLSVQVRNYPGKVHVYRIGNLKEPYAFSQRQRRRAGEKYGWWNLKCATTGRLLGYSRLPRLLDVSVSYDQRRRKELYITPLTQPAFCSQAVVSDLRAAGRDAFPTKAAWEIDPNMLATIAEYQFTLTYAK